MRLNVTLMLTVCLALSFDAQAFLFFKKKKKVVKQEVVAQTKVEKPVTKGIQ